jgi:hypothetical protein
VQHAAAVGGGEQRSGVGVGAGGGRWLAVIRVGAGRAQQLRPDHRAPRTAVGVRAPQHGAVGRVADEVVCQGLADAEDGDQAGAERGIFL